MNAQDLVLKVVRTFDQLSIPYFVTGGMAAIAYGEPRYTSDLDVVADIPLEMVPGFVAAFAFPEYYLEVQTMLTAIRERRQFNVLHPASGLKVDVIIPKDHEYDRLRMARAGCLPLTENVQGRFASPEDVILKKLAFYQAGGSEKHLRDIASILLIRASLLDREYITDWASRLGVNGEWQLVLQRVNAAPH